MSGSTFFYYNGKREAGFDRDNSPENASRKAQYFGQYVQWVPPNWTQSRWFDPNGNEIDAPPFEVTT